MATPDDGLLQNSGTALNKDKHCCSKQRKILAAVLISLLIIAGAIAGVILYEIEHKKQSVMCVSSCFDNDFGNCYDEIHEQDWIRTVDGMIQNEWTPLWNDGNGNGSASFTQACTEYYFDGSQPVKFRFTTNPLNQNCFLLCPRGNNGSLQHTQYDFKPGECIETLLCSSGVGQWHEFMCQRRQNNDNCANYADKIYNTTLTLN